MTIIISILRVIFISITMTMTAEKSGVKILINKITMMAVTSAIV